MRGNASGAFGRFYGLGGVPDRVRDCWGLFWGQGCGCDPVCERVGLVRGFWGGGCQDQVLA